MLCLCLGEMLLGWVVCVELLVDSVIEEWLVMVVLDVLFVGVFVGEMVEVMLVLLVMFEGLLLFNVVL